MESDAFGVGTNWETHGWVLTDDAAAAPVGDYIVMNDPNGQLPFNSCISVFAGTTDDTGGNAQLDLINGGLAIPVNNCAFPHLWIDSTGSGVTNLDNTTWMFACRVGFEACVDADTGDGDWNGKAFIGWADAGDTSIMTHNTGVITIASDGPLVGFHIPEDGSIDGISHRTAATVMAEGTNFTEIRSAGAVDNTVASGVETAYDTNWWDLALRMDITDSSETTGNGFTTFYSRQVNMLPGSANPGTSGRRENPWTRHGTVLTDQTPASATVMVPTIEVLNGPTADQDVAFHIDWWAFGKSRISVQSRNIT